ncbi:MAG TPA: NAD-dependent epimerase/dehydratase family protein [Acidimicrobiales bacterium]|nr:NAD-dependent epimerase/dehydratase family protein [Acidimicrobiales bacterium]HUB70975.1 NAD-dependent epimerase/dehydratase family protein [Acidimicrobiales bacterium]
MRAVVTGAAGFIGSHLCERLVSEGHEVLGIDCFTDYYAKDDKLDNIAQLQTSAGFRLSQTDLRDGQLRDLLDGTDLVFHQAAQPGVRGSWADGFAEYCSNNILATQRLLEAAHVVGVRRLVYASSSSVYGNAARYPVEELDLPRPASPYGVTKLAAEHLCTLYAQEHGVPVVSLRYFTVYGPRQRPDMAFRRLVDFSLAGRPFPLYGTGDQVRDFTYVDDVVEANLLAASSNAAPGSVANIAGGTSASMLDVIRLLEALLGHKVTVDRLPGQPGDVGRTSGATERAAALLGWRPLTALEDGLTKMVDWGRARHRDRP